MVKIPHMGEMNIEVKARKGGTGFKTLARWIGSADMLMLVEDFEEPKVVMSWRTFKRFLDIAKIYFRQKWMAKIHLCVKFGFGYCNKINSICQICK